jgi:multicomponent Na+:H+ antiporter subunit C
MLEFIGERYNYWMIIGLMMIGLYITFQSSNLIKRLTGLSIFQTSVFLFYVTLSKVAGGSAPILYGKDWKKKDKGAEGGAAEGATGAGPEYAGEDVAVYGPVDGLYETYSNPLPHVLILTAIVVGVATLSLGLALIVRIREAYGSIEADEVARIDLETALAEAADREESEAAA